MKTIQNPINTVNDLYKKLKELKVRIKLVDGKLDIQAPKGVLTPEILSEIRQHKQEIIAFIKNYQDSYHEYEIIPSVEEQESYPLSSSQYRLWVLSQFEEGSISYNMPGVQMFENINPEYLQKAFEAVINRHEILRTIFKENEEGEVRQYILKPEEVSFTIKERDLRREPELNSTVMEAVTTASTAPFHLGEGPLYRGLLLRVSNEHWFFVYVMHHIISDGWSMEVMLRELMTFYSAYAQGESIELPPLNIHYKDYSVWQQELLSSKDFKSSEAYWLEHFSGELPILGHFGDAPRPPVKTFSGGSLTYRIENAFREKLIDFCKKEKGTLFMGLFSIASVLLHKYTSQEDMIIGTPIAGREHPDLQDQIGFYVNTLAIRLTPERDLSFRQFFKETKESILGAYDHQEYPFDALVERLGLDRDISRNALFDVMVAFQSAIPGNAYSKRMDALKATYGVDSASNTKSKYDLTFDFTDYHDMIALRLEYNSDIYSDATASALARHFVNLLDSLVSAPDNSIKTHGYLSSQEEYELLEGFNKTRIQYPKNSTITELFRVQAAKHPHRTALVYEEQSLSYKELEEVSNRFAHYLTRDHLVKAGDLVSVQLERSTWQLISVLGILKCGAAYVPLDTDYPQDRIDYMLKDTNSSVVINADFITAFETKEDTLSNEAFDTIMDAESLAYLMYTSGSTGRPKGVMVTHRNVIRLVRSANFVTLTGEETLLSTGAFSFDATTFEFWSMLLNGGRLVLCDQERLMDSTALADYIKEQEVDTMWFTAGWLHQLIDEDIRLFSGLKTVLGGGDKLSPSHMQKLLDAYPDIQIINGYGPTENTTFSLTHKVTQPVPASVPIGKPISNSTAYILDKDLNLCGIGIPGEICLGGDGISKGYWNQPELTAEKFIRHPYNDMLLYRTGDLGRWRHDGTVEFLGRKDDQVKIRGYRIEPGEIENTLEKIENVHSVAVVTAEEKTSEKVLVAYVVSKNFTASELRQKLSKELPDYMIPSYFVFMDSLPLTPNGKVDRKALRLPENMEMHAGTPYVAPRNETEERLTELWKDILQKDKIGVHDHFFELGGHSLKATRLIGRIHRDFGVKLQLREIFTHITIEEQAALLLEKQPLQYNVIPKVAVQKDYPLSLTQRRLWILSQFEQANIAYNIPALYLFEGVLDIEALSRSLITVIERHESLRTVFKENEEGEVRQVIYPLEASGFVLTNEDLTQFENPKTRLNELLREELTSPIELSKGPLLKAGVYRIGSDQWVFSSVIHHIISDGWSLNVLVKEVLQCYHAYCTGTEPALKSLPIQYKDFAAWQIEELSGDSLAEHKAYWLDQFSGELPILDISRGKKRPPVKTFNGDDYLVQLPGHINEKFEKLLREEDSSLFMGLLSIVNILFYHYTEQEDIIIGSPVAGREHHHLEDQIGFYVNTLAFRTQFEKTNTFREILQKVKKVVLQGYEHQIYPFDDLVHALGLQRDMSRNPLFDVQVIVHKGENISKETTAPEGGLKVSRYKTEVPQSAVFDLVLNFMETPEGLSAGLIYNTDIFEAQQIQQMVGHLVQLLESVLEQPESPICDLEYITPEEKKLVLEDFNSLKLDYDRDKTVVDLFK
uniref:amino acid adenylation domain-containing protein n=1 Tax=Ascidiimonas aurantiaca TaxID=1685432 RepID=UPI0030EB3DAE